MAGRVEKAWDGFSYWARVRMTKYGDDMTGRWRKGSEGSTLDGAKEGRNK